MTSHDNGQGGLFDQPIAGVFSRYGEGSDRPFPFPYKMMIDGMTCTCCNQFVKLYRRKVNAQQARSLIWLCHAYNRKRDWIDLAREAPRFVIENRELPRLWYWGLVEQHREVPEGKRTSGLWRPLPPAGAYIWLRLSIPKYALIFDKTLYGFEGERLDIKAALGTKFDYYELMRGE